MNVTDGIDALAAAGRQMLDQFAAIAPALVTAIGLLIVGGAVGWLLKRGVAKLIGALVQGIRNRVPRLSAAAPGMDRRLAAVTGRVVFWVVFVVFVAAAAETLGLPILAAWAGQVGVLLPRLFAGGVIVGLGLLAGAVVRDVVTAAARTGGVGRADLLGRAAQAPVVVTAAVTGLDQIGLDSRFVTAMVSVTVGGAIGGAALAFAFGARREVSNIVALHYVRQIHRIGQLVTVGGVRGRIRAFTKTTVVVATDAGDAHVPGRTFSDHVTEVAAPEA